MIIIKDTREKVGAWTFGEEHTEIIQKLDTGDYSLQGFEHLLCIERKRAVSELCTNITDERFERELERMTKYQYRFLILEFDIDDILRYPIGSGIPQSKWSKLRINGKYIMSAISKIQINHNISVVFAGCRDNAIYSAVNIMKKVYAKHVEEKTI